jgi:hypothetical protein
VAAVRDDAKAAVPSLWRLQEKGFSTFRGILAARTDSVKGAALLNRQLSLLDIGLGKNTLLVNEK